MRHLTSVELTDEEKLDQILPIPLSKKPDFPCGLKITLTEKEFEKLGLDPEEAEVGGLVHLFAMARVTSVHSHKEDGEEKHRCELQIEDLAIESEDDEEEPYDEENEGYGKKNKKKY